MPKPKTTQVRTVGHVTCDRRGKELDRVDYRLYDDPDEVEYEDGGVDCSAVVLIETRNGEEYRRWSTRDLRKKHKHAKAASRAYDMLVHLEERFGE